MIKKGESASSPHSHHSFSPRAAGSVFFLCQRHSRTITSTVAMSSPLPKTPAEGIDQWFDSLQQHETTLEEMVAASMDLKFKEELTAVEQWFKALTEAERTASLYSLLQHSTQNQIRFFIAVLQQMARSDPMTAGLTSATTGVSQMQFSQLKATAAKATSLSPLARSFTPGSPIPQKGSGMNLHSPSLGSPNESTSQYSTTTTNTPLDSAAVLAQQRQRLNASRAAQQHLAVPVSAPLLPKTGEDGRPLWGPPERRPATIDEERREDAVGGGVPGTPTDAESWSSMVKTPLVSMFPKGVTTTTTTTTDAGKVLWNNEGVVPQIGDAAIYRRGHKGATAKKKGSVFGGGAAPQQQQLPPVPMTTPTSPYNLSMLGVTPEQHLYAVQLLLGGMLPNGLIHQQIPPQQPQQQQQPSGRWRAQSSAGLKSAASNKSTGVPKSAGSNGPSSGVINRDHETDMELLKDIPAWLKALRLHKYAASFEGLEWREMVVLDEGELERRGVVTVGARKRFLRLFEAVRKCQGMEGGGGATQEGAGDGDGAGASPQIAEKEVSVVSPSPTPVLDLQVPVIAAAA